MWLGRGRVIHVRDEVVVVRIDDGEGFDEENPPRIGQIGRVLRRLVGDHGSRPADPLLKLRFTDGFEDAYWATEVVKVPASFGQQRAFSG